jgi:hypothetical protein
VTDAFPWNASEYDRYVRDLLPRLEGGAGVDTVAAEIVMNWFRTRDGHRNEARHPLGSV